MSENTLRVVSNETETPAEEVHPLVALAAKRVEVAFEGKARAHATYVTLVQGGRIAPVAKTEGTYVRDCITQARKRAIKSLDLVTACPGKSASDDEYLAWLGFSSK